MEKIYTYKRKRNNSEINLFDKDELKYPEFRLDSL